MKAGRGENKNGGGTGFEVQYLPWIWDLVMGYNSPHLPQPSPVLGGLQGQEESAQDKSRPFSHLATPPQHSQSWNMSGPQPQLD